MKRKDHPGEGPQGAPNPGEDPQGAPNPAEVETNDEPVYLPFGDLCEQIGWVPSKEREELQKLRRFAETKDLTNLSNLVAQGVQGSLLCSCNNPNYHNAPYGLDNDRLCELVVRNVYLLDKYYKHALDTVIDMLITMTGEMNSTEMINEFQTHARVFTGQLKNVMKRACILDPRLLRQELANIGSGRFELLYYIRNMLLDYFVQNKMVTRFMIITRRLAEGMKSLLVPFDHRRVLMSRIEGSQNSHLYVTTCLNPNCDDNKDSLRGYLETLPNKKD